MATDNNVVRYKYVCTCGDAAGIYAKTMYLSSVAPQAPSASSVEGLTLRKKYEDALFENKEEFKSRTRLLEKYHLENLDEKDRLIKVLRHTVTDLEKQLREQESLGPDGHWSSPSHNNTGSLQRLLDQIERLQRDKQKMLRSLAEFKVTGSDELLIDSPLFQRLLVPDQKSQGKGQDHIQEELGQCTTDTEKELEQTIKRKHVLEKEMMHLRLENHVLHQQISRLGGLDANHNYQLLSRVNGTVPLSHAQEPMVITNGSASDEGNSAVESANAKGHDGASAEELSSLGKQIEELRAQLQVKADELQQTKIELQNETHERSAAVEVAQSAMSSEVDRLSSSLSTLADIACHVYREFQSVKESYMALREQMIGFPLSLGTCMVHIQKQIQQSLSDLASTNREVVQKYLREMKLRKKYHNELVELRGNIRVLCRVRPCIDEDGVVDTDLVVTPDLEDDGVIRVNYKGRIQSFDLDKVFGIDSTQAQIFDEVSALVRSVIDGYNVCIFAYGQTGSGKTYTMEGPSGDPGINQRALQLLFEETKDSNWQYEIAASVLEIYNEAIRDLLNPDPSNRKEVKMNPEGGYHVPGIVTRPVTSLEEVNEVFRIGRQNRATASTNMNEHSSRSHCLLCVSVRGFNPTTASTTYGRLNLVDLAGSERVGKSQADGVRLKEAQNINRSLACLGDVMHALRNKNSHVPYRNSKLTFLLQDSLGGDSKTLMIVQVAPVEKNVAESLCTLAFGQRVKSVELGQATRSTNGSSKSSSSSKKSKKPGRPSILNLSGTSSIISRSSSASSCNSSHNSSFASEFSSSASSPTFALDRSQMSSPFFDFAPVFSSSAVSSPSTTPTCRTPTPQSPTSLLHPSFTPKTTDSCTPTSTSSKSPSPSPWPHVTHKARERSTPTSAGAKSANSSHKRTPTVVRKSPSTPTMLKPPSSALSQRRQGQGLQRSATFTVKGASPSKA